MEPDFATILYDDGKPLIDIKDIICWLVKHNKIKTNMERDLMIGQ